MIFKGLSMMEPAQEKVWTDKKTIMLRMIIKSRVDATYDTSGYATVMIISGRVSTFRLSGPGRKDSHEAQI